MQIGTPERRDTNWSTIFFIKRYLNEAVCSDGLDEISNWHPALISRDNKEIDKNTKFRKEVTAIDCFALLSSVRCKAQAGKNDMKN